MNYQTAAALAQKMGVTVRTIQKWAKEGKFPGAYKAGRDWLIPEEMPSAVMEGTPFPLFTYSYTPGTLYEYCCDIPDEDERNIALSEYYYFTGDLKQSTITAEPYLDAEDDFHRISAALFCAFSNLCREHVHMTDFAAGIVREELDKLLAQSATPQEQANTVLAAMIIKMQLHFTVDNVPEIEPFLKYLPDGHREIACYLVAYKAYMEKDYKRSIGIAETALYCATKKMPLVEIYLHIISAMDYMNLLDTQRAKDHLAKAWALAIADKVTMPFVEHYSLLQGLLEQTIKNQKPELYQRILGIVKRYNTGWYTVYKQRNPKSIADNLTPVEFTVAMLYSRNWRAKEIAAHMCLSERTITNHIQVIYEKLQINGRKALEQYMLQ